MTAFIFVVKIFITIHILIAICSLCNKQSWLQKKPSFKLQLIRILLASCILSPIAAQLIKQTEQPTFVKLIPMDIFNIHPQERVSEQKKLLINSQSHIEESKLVLTRYWYLIFIPFFIGSLYQLSNFLKDLGKLRYILRESLSFRQHGKLVIKVTDLCHVPFSFYCFGKSFIILPISILNSSTDTKLSIAHEGQHHRQYDCLWAYFIEGISIAFWGNPFLSRLRRILTELQEYACDESVVGHQEISAHDYGRCLFTVAQTASQYSKNCSQHFACTVGMAWNSEIQKTSLITRRISMLSQYERHMIKRPLLSLVLISSAILIPLCTAFAAKETFPQSNKSIDTSSLEPKIQQIAEQEITAAVKKYHAKSAAIAIADPHTGKIIAFAESGIITNDHSWRTRLFAPGSTIKPFVAAAAIDAGISSENKTYDCRSPYNIDGTKFTNPEDISNSISLKEAMEKSINICLIKVAEELGSSQKREYSERRSHCSTCVS